MNIIDIIKSQHREFRALMDQVRDTQSDDLEERKRLFELTRSKLHAHGRAEEHVLFPRMEEDARTRQAALEAWEWHRASNRLMKGILQLSPADELWLPKWLVIRGTILAHLDAEEARALELLGEVFGAEELEGMGRDFLAIEESIRSKKGED
jgi:hypothetical protein